MENYVNKKIMSINEYIVTLIITALAMIFFIIFNNSNILVVAYIVVGIKNIYSCYKKNKLILTPISLFSLIWLILMPMCSFKYPIMEKMSLFEWEKCSFFIYAFCIGGIISNYVKLQCKKKNKLLKISVQICFLVLIISIICSIKLIVDFGSIPLFSSDANLAKFSFQSHSIYRFISYFGIASIILLVLDNKNIIRNRKFLLLVISYIFSIILRGERFSPIILLTFIILTKCKEKINKELLIVVFKSCIIIVTIFLFILNYRGNAEQKKKYFIDTGIYNGSAQKLQNTEIIRYFGMSFRLITVAYEKIIPGETHGCLTFSPMLKIFGINVRCRNGIVIYGYNASTMITYLYSDFGEFWPIIVIILSIIINVSFKSYEENNSIISKYFCIIWQVVLLFSFYTYINYLIIYFLHIPIFIVLIHILNNSLQIKIN